MLGDYTSSESCAVADGKQDKVLCDKSAVLLHVRLIVAGCKDAAFEDLNS